MGEKLFDSRFSLIDNGSYTGRVGSRPFDNQGVRTRRLPLVENGVISPALNLQTAAVLGKESTGHAVEDDYVPFYHLEMPIGEKSHQQLISEMGRGILITGSMGILDSDPLTGVISGTISSGYLIENGELIGCIRNASFQCNAFRHLRDHLLDFSRDTHQVELIGTYATLPYILLDSIQITSV